MKTRILLTVVTVLSALTVLAAGMWHSAPAAASAPAPTGDVPRTITVVGEGQVTKAPDTAVINMGVQVSDSDVKAATKKVTDQMNSLLKALKNSGIDEKYIQTSYYNIYVDRPYTPDGNPGEATYQASNSVQVTVRDLSKITEILGAAIEAGANNINSIEFKLADASAQRSEARAKAVENAQERAAELAKLNGVQVGQVLQVSEVIDNGGIFSSEKSNLVNNGYNGSSVGPISPGEVSVDIQLQITYAILQ